MIFSFNEYNTIIMCKKYYKNINKTNNNDNNNDDHANKNNSNDGKIV